jgi:hypothetical protein
MIPYKSSTKGGFRKAGIITVALLAAIMALTNPSSDLSAEGNGIIALLLICLALWIFRTGSLPYMVGGAILLAGGLLYKLPLEVVTSGYTSSAVWVLIPALFFGFALIETGLRKRIAYFVLKTFEPSYLTICISWFIIEEISRSGFRLIGSRDFTDMFFLARFAVSKYGATMKIGNNHPMQLLIGVMLADSGLLYKSRLNSFYKTASQFLY